MLKWAWTSSNPEILMLLGIDLAASVLGFFLACSHWGFCLFCSSLRDINLEVFPFKPMPRFLYCWACCCLSGVPIIHTPGTPLTWAFNSTWVGCGSPAVLAYLAEPEKDTFESQKPSWPAQLGPCFEWFWEWRMEMLIYLLKIFLFEI